MKIAAAIVLSIFFVIIVVNAYSFVVQEGQLGSQLADVQASLAKSQAQETSLQQESQYLANPLNLEKEMRARFNYKKPGETMVIIVPSTGSSTASSTR